MKEYRCTRNSLYSHECLGHDDLTVRQGYYIEAESPEAAWEEMSVRFPEETSEGFTVEEWHRFPVTVRLVESFDRGRNLNQ
ncbi:MAG: hypothetical protein ACK48H_12395 [Microcystis sp.]|jgi:hypothetical protein|uniref:Uncharacterized protein n=1 Tax=Microcystis aeruginosa Ma_OC_H_19870700_S124 TaxID=2486262 RepID=A0A552AH96_MICAE|nr:MULTISPECIES: hypothetical protein [unclassified Microcystis]MCZ8038697.1 hypothetical protein [Microcystis sp. LE17-20A]MCZ8212303.1 hypothetical protein [Microcystis sp. LE19-8.1F]TRT84798.1 MAG: hypothetical protein EWV63_14470 [Microcystis aeruginosa Ma_OC_H_19870700_S124]